jgi:hypothetical protein
MLTEFSAFKIYLLIYFKKKLTVLFQYVLTYLLILEENKSYEVIYTSYQLLNCIFSIIIILR